MRTNKYIYMVLFIFLFAAFFPAGARAEKITVKNVYVYDATPKGLKLDTEKMIIKDLLEESISLNKKLKQLVIDDFKAMAKKMKVQESDEAGALDIAENAFSDLFLSMSLNKTPEGEYRLTLRLKDVKKRLTLYTKTIEFDSVTEAEPDIKEMSKVMFEKRKLESSLFLDLKLCYLQPLGNYADISNPGFGFAFRFGISNLVFNYCSLALETGYYRFTYNSNSNDTINHIPVFVCAAYEFRFLDKFSISPVFGCGIDFIITSHDAGKGFSLKDNSGAASTEQLIKTGLEFKMIISESTSVLISTSYNFIFEEKRLDFFNINSGAQIRL
ncbi:MAG: hypothetical protein GY754_36180 [bacterium]|nr:hypothetical protein [bacterium]